MSSSVSGMVPICLYVLPQPRHQTRLLVITTLELVRHVESNQKSIIHAQKGPKRRGGGCSRHCLDVAACVVGSHLDASGLMTDSPSVLREHMHAGGFLPAPREEHGAHEPITGSGLIALRYSHVWLMRSNSASAAPVGPVLDCLLVCLLVCVFCRGQVCKAPEERFRSG